MTDSNSFSSLLALVDSHLSKTTVQGSRSEDANVTSRIPIPLLNGTFSDTRLTFSPGDKLPIPSFSLSSSPIQSVLAEQVANMLKAKELKRQEEEEKLRLAEEMKRMKIEEDNNVIDLMKVLQSKDNSVGIDICPVKDNSVCSSMESLFEPKFIDCDDELEVVKTPEPILPCTTDMSYILFEKVNKGKCSAFGKVLTSRLRPIAAPYLKEKVDMHINRFDFTTKSPCDCIKEKLRKPTQNTSYVPDILSMIQ